MRLPLLTAACLAVTTICAGSRALAQEAPPKEEPPPPPPQERPQEEPPPPPPKERPQEEPPPAPPQPPGEEGKPPAVPGDDATDPDFEGFSLGDDSEQFTVGNERVLAAAGTGRHPLLVRLRGFEVRCKGLVLWGDRDRVVEAVERRREVLGGRDPDALLGPVIHALYAEGGVYVRLKDHEIRAERVFLDFERGQAFLERATLKGKLEGPQGRTMSLSVRADVVRATARNHYRAENARLTTCPYSDPHYEFTSEWIEVDYRGVASSFETAWWPTLRSDTVLGKDTPVLVMPKLGGDSWLTNLPVQGATFAHGSRMGTSVLVNWGGNLQREDGSRWGDWRLHTDYRSSRGPGAGADLSHLALPAKPGGRRDELDVSGYWQQDSNQFDQFSDRNFDGGLAPEDETKDRGFGHLFHRWYVENPSLTSVAGDGWRVDTEASWYSDRGYFAEYDRKKAEVEKQQETYVEARKTWGNQGVSLLGSYRLTDEASYLDINPTDLVRTDFAVQTDYLPSATYHVIGKPVLSAESTGGAFPLVLSMQAGAANVERNYDERLARRIEAASGWTSEQVQRGDLETRVNAPFSFGDLHFNPAFGGSLYGVSDSNGFPPEGGGSDVRYAGFYGVRADTQAWRAFPDAKSGFLDINGMRHVVSLDGQYFDRFKVSDASESYQSNDLVDVLAEERIGSVRVRNRLQTKRDGETVDWLDVESRFLYFFDENAPKYPGLFGVREDFPQPLQLLDFPGESKYTQFQRDGSAFWQHRARMQMLSNLWFVGEADYDMQANAMETSAVGARWFFDRRMSFYVGRRTIHSDSTIWTERLDYRLSNRWGVEVEYQSDSKTGRGLSTGVSLYRRAHDYTIAIEVSSDKQGGETSVGLAIYPNDWSGGKRDPFSLRRPLDHDALKWYR